MGRLLAIDDDPSILVLVRRSLQRDGHEVAVARTAEEGLRAFCEDPPDLVLLDLRLPDLSGWQVMHRMRALGDVPILVVSGECAEQDRVRGLLSGADDFLVKPFGVAELSARVLAVLRRCARRQATVVSMFQDGRLRLDALTRRATVDGRPLQLTPLEFRLLAAFLRHPDVALPHEKLLETAWDEAFGTRDQVKVAVLGLRRKLDAHAPGLGESIRAVRGVGYRWCPGQRAPAVAAA